MASPSAGRLAVTAEASAKAAAGLPADAFDSSALLDASRSIRGQIPDDGKESTEYINGRSDNDTHTFAGNFKRHIYRNTSGSYALCLKVKMQRGLQHARNADASVERINLNRPYEKKKKGIPGHDVGFAFAPRRLIDQRVEPRRRKMEPRASMAKWLRKARLNCASR